MKVQEIIANAIDLAGDDSIDVGIATLACLNVIDTMMLELANSSKGIKGLKENIEFCGGLSTGELSKTNLALGSFFVRFRETCTSKWEILEILDDIEDLTRYEMEGRRAVMFTGTNPLVYHLSFKPQRTINAELWGKTIGAEINNLNSLAPFPAEFSLYCAYRTADFTLNQLLKSDAKKWQAFVIAQKASIAGEIRRLEHIWAVYRANPAAANSIQQVQPYDRFADMQDDFSGFYLIGRRY